MTKSSGTVGVVTVVDFVVFRRPTVVVVDGYNSANSDINSSASDIVVVLTAEAGRLKIETPPG